ncbi:MAG TPA: hypothetical protein VNM24_03285 [Burkholderiales bacterium]|jgi:DNA-directed RNA polymerase specialized sigma24 family protein|nr:hypothetical protein [Burkholderiales bacterium]
MNTETSIAVANDPQWQRALAGDRQAFWAIVEPHLAEMLQAAGRDIRYHESLGQLGPQDLAPEELVGETLIRAWHGRHHRPRRLSLRAWLLGSQHRVLQWIVAREQRLRQIWSVSLESAPPREPVIYDDDASYWEWHQPDDFVRWEDLIPGDVPAPEEFIALEEAPLDQLDAQARQALLLRFEHRLAVAEIAYILRLPVEQTRRLIGELRTEARSATARE